MTKFYHTNVMVFQNQEIFNISNIITSTDNKNHLKKIEQPHLIFSYYMGCHFYRWKNKLHIVQPNDIKWDKSQHINHKNVCFCSQVNEFNRGRNQR